MKRARADEEPGAAKQPKLEPKPESGVAYRSMSAAVPPPPVVKGKGEDATAVAVPKGATPPKLYPTAATAAPTAGNDAPPRRSPLPPGATSGGGASKKGAAAASPAAAPPAPPARPETPPDLPHDAPGQVRCLCKFAAPSSAAAPAPAVAPPARISAAAAAAELREWCAALGLAPDPPPAEGPSVTARGGTDPATKPLPSDRGAQLRFGLKPPKARPRRIVRRTQSGEGGGAVVDEMDV